MLLRLLRQAPTDVRLLVRIYRVLVDGYRTDGDVKLTLPVW